MNLTIAFYRLEDHNSYEKLSKNKIKYLKEVLLANNMKKKKIQFKFNISRSVIDRIKRTPF